MNATKAFFEGLYKADRQAVFIYSAQGELIYSNEVAKAWSASVEVSAEALFEAARATCNRCIARQSGAEFSFADPSGVHPFYILPYEYQGACFAVVRMVWSSEERQLDQILWNSDAKLNGYLNSIYGIAQELGLEEGAGARLGKEVHRIMRMKAHLSSLMGRGAEDYMVPMNFSAYVLGVARSAAELKPDFQIDLPEPSSKLYARMMPEYMEVVLSALLSNAYRFGGSAALEMGEEDGKIFLRVIDDGAEIQAPERLFEGGLRTADRFGARGLGFSLALCKKLLQAQGGALRYERAGGKNVFTVLLEKSELPIGTMLAEWPAEPAGNSLSRLRIELSDIL